MCKFEENVKTMTFENCNLFRRSFTTQGLGYTFNNEKADKLIKHDFQNTLFASTKISPSLMKSTNWKHSLTAVIEHNVEEVEMYENANSFRTKQAKPREITVSVHNPKEPGDTNLIPLSSTQIPLGQSTTFLISAKAREIDETGKKLSESKRGCRLDEDTDSLDIFNVYTRTGCLFECNLKYSVRKCGCTPWNYPVNMKSKA